MSCYLSYIMQLADIKEKKNKKKKLGCVWDLIPGPLELQSNALPTELRGLWLQVNSYKLYLYLGWRGVTWHVKLTNEKCCMPKIEHIKLWCGSVKSVMHCVLSCYFSYIVPLADIV